VFDGERYVGRIFLDANGKWFWGLSFEFHLTGRKSYGRAATLEEGQGGRFGRNTVRSKAAPTEPPFAVRCGRMPS
jgi:hypothetical protein